VIGKLAELSEASGLASSRRHPGVLWSHNDSADAVLYAVGEDGGIKGRVRVTGAAVDDWEAITTADCAQGSCLYIGDIGDNHAARGRIRIYRTAEPAITDAATAPAQALEAIYPDGPQDAEAMFVAADGTLFIVTKGEGRPVHVYRVPLGGDSPVRAVRVATLTQSAAAKALRVTDAATSPNGQWVVLRTNDKLFFYRTADLIGGRPGTPYEFDLRALREPQGEGIAWPRDADLFLAGEGGGGGTFARVSCTLPSS
jgi:hypothetical protein